MAGSFGATVKRLREEHGWRQEDLARKADIPQATISRIERGVNSNPTQDTLTKLAMAFGISPPQLLREAGLEYPRLRPPLPGTEHLPAPLARVMQRIGQYLNDADWERVAAYAEGLAAARRAPAAGVAEAGPAYAARGPEPEEEAEDEAGRQAG